MQSVDYKRVYVARKARLSLEKRTSPEWAKAIAGLRCGRVCRIMAAQIVWWDYFAKKPASPHDATLDAYKADWDYMVIRRTPIRVKAESIVAALMTLGYAEAVAKKRAEVLT